MYMRRKILLGVTALALPATSLAFFPTASFATKAPPNPVSCGLSATANISGAGLTVAGTLSAKGQTQSTTVAATLNGCSNPAVNGTPLTITIVTPAAKPGKDTAAIAAGDNKKSYYLGLCGNFASSGTIKDLKKAVKNLSFQGGILKGAKPSEGTVGPDVGFNITNGTVKGGTYPTASHGASIAAGLTNNSNNSNLIGGCQGGPVTHIDIDSSVSTATL
jgi:hypothetical protein